MIDSKNDDDKRRSISSDSNNMDGSSSLLTVPTISSDINSNSQAINAEGTPPQNEGITLQTKYCCFVLIMVMLYVPTGVMLGLNIPHMRNYRGNKEYVDQNCTGELGSYVSVGFGLWLMVLLPPLPWILFQLMNHIIKKFKRQTEGQWVQTQCFIVGFRTEELDILSSNHYKIVQTDWIQGKRYAREQQIPETEYQDLMVENNFLETGTRLPIQEEYRYLPGYPLSITTEWWARDDEFLDNLGLFLMAIGGSMIFMIFLLDFYVGGFLNWNRHGCRETVMGLTLGLVLVLACLACLYATFLHGKMKSGKDFVVNGHSWNDQETWKEVASNDNHGELEDGTELIERSTSLQDEPSHILV